MNCISEIEQGKIIALLTFKREQLMYDVKNYAYIEGSIMDADNDHYRHTVQDIGEEGNVDRVTRVLNLTIARCRELLYPYTKHGIVKHKFDDVLREPDVYGIIMKLPEGFSQTTLSLLEKLIHEYLVCCAVADWISITYPNKTSVWASKVSDLESEIRTSVNTRISRTRIRLHPF